MVPGDLRIGDSTVHGDLRKEIYKRSWFGTAKHAFFWGYQTQEKLNQPNYDRLTEHVSVFIQEIQNDFVQRWTKWMQKKNRVQNTPIRIGLIYLSDLKESYL